MQEVFKEGIGDNEDLKTLVSRPDNIANDNLTVDAFMTGQEQKTKNVYPSSDVTIELTAYGNKTQIHKHPQDYHLKTNSYPNFDVQYTITSEKNGNVVDTHTGSKTVNQTNGETHLVDLSGLNNFITGGFYFNYKPCILLSKDTSVSMQDMYNNWVNFAATGSGDKGTWSYDSANDEITNSENQSNVAGYYSENHVPGGSDELSDYSFNGTIYTEDGDNDTIGFVFRFQDPNNYYAFHWIKDSGAVQVEDNNFDGMAIIKMENGNRTVIDKNDGYYYSSNTNEDIKIRAYDNKLEVYHTGGSNSSSDPVLSVTDDTFSKGAFGPITYSQPNTSFKNINLTKYKVEKGSEDTAVIPDGNTGIEYPVTSQNYNDIISNPYDDYNVVEYYSKITTTEYQNDPNVSMNRDVEGDVPIKAEVSDSSYFQDLTIKATSNIPSNYIDLGWGSPHNSNETTNDSDILYCEVEAVKEETFDDQVNQPGSKSCQLPTESDLINHFSDLDFNSHLDNPKFKFTVETQSGKTNGDIHYLFREKLESNHSSTNSYDDPESSDFNYDSDDKETNYHKVNNNLDELSDGTKDSSDAVKVFSTVEISYSNGDLWASNGKAKQVTVNGAGPNDYQRQDGIIGVEFKKLDSAVNSTRNQDLVIYQDGKAIHKTIDWPADIRTHTIYYEVVVDGSTYGQANVEFVEINNGITSLGSQVHYESSNNSNNVDIINNSNIAIKAGSSYTESRTYDVFWKSSDVQLSIDISKNNPWEQYFYIDNGQQKPDGGLASNCHTETISNPDIHGPFGLVLKNKPDVVNIKQETLRNNDYYKITGTVLDSVIWRPKTHNGYFYLRKGDLDNEVIDEHYFYKNTPNKTINNPGDEIYLTENEVTEPIPQQDAPVLIKDNNGNQLRRVYFTDNNGNLTLYNSETLEVQKDIEPYNVEAEVKNSGNKVQIEKIEGKTIFFKEETLADDPSNNSTLSKDDKVNISYKYPHSNFRNLNDLTVEENLKVTLDIPDFINSIYLSYKNVDKDSISIYNADTGNPINYLKDSINDNFIQLDLEDDISGQNVDVNYKLKDSFFMEYGYNSQSKSRIKLSNNNYSSININYKQDKNSPFRTINSINLNPYVNNISSGFIFLTNHKRSVDDINLVVYPDKIAVNRRKKVNFKLTCTNSYENPVDNRDISDKLNLNCNHGTVKYIKEDGTTTTDINNITTDQQGCIYGEYEFDSNKVSQVPSSITKDTLSLNYNSGAIQKDKNISLYTIDTEEYFIFLTNNSEEGKKDVQEGRSINLKVTLLDRFYTGVTDTDVSISAVTNTQNNETLTTDSNGNIEFDFNVGENGESYDTVTAEATINGKTVTDDLKIDIIVQ